jgi:hypothetical protein
VGVGVEGLGSRVHQLEVDERDGAGPGVGVQGAGFRVWDLGLRVYNVVFGVRVDLGLRIYNAFKVEDLSCRVRAEGVRLDVVVEPRALQRPDGARRRHWHPHHRALRRAGRDLLCGLRFRLFLFMAKNCSMVHGSCMVYG